jgi:hypothetical protein
VTVLAAFFVAEPATEIFYGGNGTGFFFRPFSAGWHFSASFRQKQGPAIDRVVMCGV